VELRVNPIGIGGSQFIFHPGLEGKPAMEGDFIPTVNSDEGKEYIANGLIIIPNQDDSITVIITRVNTLLQNINGMVTQLRDGLRGTDTSPLGRSLTGVENTIRDISSLVGGANQSMDPILGDIKQITEGIQSVLTDLKIVTGELSNPDSLILTALDTNGAVYANIKQSLESLSGTLKSVETLAAALPTQVPQVAALISDLRETLESAEDVIIALRNNPLLKNGVPDKGQGGTGGTSPRDVSF
jgi:phospholipid/cholesterol/gamma-HCH transport system substrate-binding protein